MYASPGCHFGGVRVYTLMTGLLALYLQAAAMHVWGVTIQGLLSNYIYDGSPRNVPYIIEDIQNICIGIVDPHWFHDFNADTDPIHGSG